MRVLITVLALVTAPFLASVAQEPPGRSPCWTVQHGSARDIHSQGQGNHYAKGHAKHACAPPVGDGGGGSGSTGGGTGDGTGGGTGGSTGGGGSTAAFAVIGGMLFNDANANAGIFFGMDGADSPLSGWTVELKLLNADGTVASTTSTSTDPWGNYAFPDLPGGTYLVCEVVQSGWRLTFPGTPRPCSGGFGYTVPVPADLVQPTYFGFNDFGNTTLP